MAIALMIIACTLIMALAHTLINAWGLMPIEALAAFIFGVFWYGATFTLVGIGVPYLVTGQVPW